MAKYVVFRLGTEDYGISIEQVRSIETMQPITRVPIENPCVMGVMNLRGIVIPVLDLGKRLGMPQLETTKETRIIVVSQGEMEVGVMVDAAKNVIDIDDEALQPPADSAGKLLFVQAMAMLGDKVLSLLDLQGILDPESALAFTNEEREQAQ